MRDMTDAPNQLSGGKRKKEGTHYYDAAPNAAQSDKALLRNATERRPPCPAFYFFLLTSYFLPLALPFTSSFFLLPFFRLALPFTSSFFLLPSSRSDALFVQ
jgi:hypothetical protein